MDLSIRQGDAGTQRGPCRAPRVPADDVVWGDDGEREAGTRDQRERCSRHGPRRPGTHGNKALLKPPKRPHSSQEDGLGGGSDRKQNRGAGGGHGGRETCPRGVSFEGDVEAARTAQDSKVPRRCTCRRPGGEVTTGARCPSHRCEDQRVPRSADEPSASTSWIFDLKLSRGTGDTLLRLGR